MDTLAQLKEAVARPDFKRAFLFTRNESEKEKKWIHVSRDKIRLVVEDGHVFSGPHAYEASRESAANRLLSFASRIGLPVKPEEIVLGSLTTWTAERAKTTAEVVTRFGNPEVGEWTSAKQILTSLLDRTNEIGVNYIEVLCKPGWLKREHFTWSGN